MSQGVSRHRESVVSARVSCHMECHATESVLCHRECDVSQDALSMEFSKLLSESLVLGNKTMFRMTTKNKFWLYEFQPCFNDTAFLMQDLNVYNGKVSDRIIPIVCIFFGVFFLLFL